MSQDNIYGEIVLYQPNESIKLEVKLEDETVWLTQQQMVELFDSSKANISEHISSIFEQDELDKDSTVRNFRTVRQEGSRTVTRNIDYYNLDVIISAGFRVNTSRGIRFRKWANKVLKEYLIKGYSVNQHLIAMQHQVDIRMDEQNVRLTKLEENQIRQQEQVEIWIKGNSLPEEKPIPAGCVFDAWHYVSSLVRSAKKRIILIDDFVDDRVLSLLQKRGDSVAATIHTRYTSTFVDDLEKYNQQYPPIGYVQLTKRNHDRFLIVDNVAYLLGASLKDMGTGLCAIAKMELRPEVILNEL